MLLRTICNSCPVFSDEDMYKKDNEPAVSVLQA